MSLVLRICTEGRGLKWGFWPRGAQADSSQNTEGIWIDGAYNPADQLEDDSVGSGGEQSEAEDDEDEESNEDSESGKSGDENEETRLIAIAGGSRFGALSLNDGEEM